SRIFRFNTDTPGTAPVLFKDLSGDSDQPFGSALALINFDSNNTGAKPHVFAEGGNDSRVPLRAVSPFFRMYGLRDDSTSPAATPIATNVFTPVDFPKDFRGTVQPATTFTAGTTPSALVFFAGTRFNPAGSTLNPDPCLSGFDSILFAHNGATAGA